MKIEDIEKEAREESGEWAPCPIHLYDLYRRDDFEAGFHRGANWRIYSVWHDVSEEPQGNNELLVLNSEGVAFFIKSYCWKDEVKILGIVKWAYIKDLIPTED